MDVYLRITLGKHKRAPMKRSKVRGRPRGKHNVGRTLGYCALRNGWDIVLYGTIFLGLHRTGSTMVEAFEPCYDRGLHF